MFKMSMAATAIRNGELSVREASSVYGIPKSTLERHKNKKVLVPGCLGRFQPTLQKDMEKDLASYCTNMQQCLFGLTLTDMRRMAFQVAERNGISHRLDK